MDTLLQDFVEVAPHTPFDSGAPHINGPAEFGVSPGRECVYAFPVRGERPLAFRVDGELPPGIRFDQAAGRFSGRTEKEGDYPLKISAANRLGETEKAFTLRVHPHRIGLAPLLGWTSWNACRLDFDQDRILRIAHALVNSGLAARGYSYINIDSGWQGCTRDRTSHALNANHRFPDMAAMVREIHALGLHAGIYSTPMVIAWGSTLSEIFRGSRDYPVDASPGMQPSSLFHFGGIGKTPLEKEDAARWAEWGFDYLKYDWPGCDIRHARYMADALRATDRDFVFSLTTQCSPGFAHEYRAVANMYRNNLDTAPEWASLRSSIASADDWLAYTGAGGWFDLDMLAVGPVHADCGSTKLTRDETILEFSAWALLGSPIQISCDLERIDDFTLDVLSNEEVLAVNQDTWNRAELIRHTIDQRNGKPFRELRIYCRHLADGSEALGFFNLGDAPYSESFALHDECAIRDLWACRDLGRMQVLNMCIPAHGARMFRVCK